MLEKDLQLTDIFDIDLLQRLQEAFYNATDISAGFSDINGVAITKHSSHTAFCKEFNKKSEIGLSRCQNCDKYGMHLALEKKGPVTYTCHAGLMDFAAPIIVKGKVLGCLLGGQVAEHPLDLLKVRAYAEEINVDPEEYANAAGQVTITSRERIESSANFLFTIGDMLSHMAYKKYNVMQESTEIEREAHMKSDFLATMSHEIRTPMNAVIGMAEMALREELPPAAREYINQIKTAGNVLLTLINDILDFSKIEAGKMDINMAEYRPVSIINDVTNIIMTRIGTKKLELIVDFDPKIPRQLMGDSIRIKQIITNLANNAVKFTPEGKVVMRVSYTKRSEKEILLKVSIKDTGIGIKEEDMSKLFQSFQQLDSKRNRNIEGSGLGLAISKQLVSLMNGRIRVESEYGAGSTFSFELPQIVLDEKPSIVIQETHPITACVLSDNPYIQKALKKDIERFDATYIPVEAPENLPDIPQLAETSPEAPVYLFIDNPAFCDETQEFLKTHPNIVGVRMVDFGTSTENDTPHLLIMKKPIYSLNMGAIFNHEDIYREFDRSNEDDFDFIAPEATVLIVDDNAVNLTVASGLMEPLQLQIETAESGKEAIEKISAKHYDIIFMDHMMPELDGVETTHIIRRFHEEYNNVPIIALTANAVEEMRSMFLCEGMNDFIAKPIELHTLISTLKNWLPKEKLQKLPPKQHRKKQTRTAAAPESSLPDIPELDWKVAMKYLGSEQLVWNVLRDYYRLIAQKAALIEEYAAKEDYGAFTIEVHALKSASRQIGAIPLSELAATLEQAGKNQKNDIITSQTPQLLKLYRRYEELLAPYFAEKDAVQRVQKPASPEEIRPLLTQMEAAIDALDMDGMDAAANALRQYSFDGPQTALCEKLSEAAELMDVDMCSEIIKEWNALL